MLWHQAVQAYLRRLGLHASVRDSSEMRGGVQHGLQRSVWHLGLHDGVRGGLLLRLQHCHKLQSNLRQWLLYNRVFLVRCFEAWA